MQTILVIDDDKAVRDAILLGLSKHGYRCLPGRNAREGIEITGRGGVDLVLSDLNLGDADESATFLSLRNYAMSKRTPFVVMTGQMDHMDQIPEADEVLVKPFTLAALLDVVRRQLKKGLAHQHQEQFQIKKKRSNRKPSEIGSPPKPSKPACREDRLSPEELEEILARVQILREEDRKELARVIHDDLTQTLTVVAIELSLLESNLRSSKARNAGGHIHSVEKLQRLLNELIRSAQEITGRLHPKVLDEFGLVAALEWLSEQANRRLGIRCELLADGSEASLGREISAGVYHACEDVLSYAARHTHASKASIKVTRQATALSIEIRHNGKVVEGASTDRAERLELMAIRKRTERLGGCFQYRVIPGGGMTARVEITIPL